MTDMPNVIYALPSSPEGGGEWYLFPAVGAIPCVRIPEGVDPATALVVDGESDELMAAYMKGKAKGQALSHLTIAMSDVDTYYHDEDGMFRHKNGEWVSLDDYREVERDNNKLVQLVREQANAVLNFEPQEGVHCPMCGAEFGISRVISEHAPGCPTPLAVAMLAALPDAKGVSDE